VAKQTRDSSVISVKRAKRAFTETKGTMFYRCRHTEDEIVECISMLGDRNSLAAIHRIKGIKEETICKWLERAATHTEQFDQIIREKKPSVQSQRLDRR